MDKFLIRKSTSKQQPLVEETNDNVMNRSKKPRVEVDLDNLPTDPGLRIRMSEYHPNDQDKPDGKKGGGDSFTLEGFTNWNKKCRFDTHVGGPNSAHNQAVKKCEDLMNQNQHIQAALVKQSNQARSEYRIRLTASVDCIRFLLHQGLAFRGHDESDTSYNQGNFLELLRFLADHNEAINNVVLQNAPKNIKLIAHDIQNEIISAAANETTKAIINDLGDELFAVLVDESRDISNKEQMAIILRYVDKKGRVTERFLSIIHVPDTTALTLKAAIELLFSKYGLSMSRIRGQGYDGASNMRGEFNGLKSLILKENENAYYVHCFAHQLQLTLVAVAKNEDYIASLFNMVANLLNVVGASCKRLDILRESQAARVIEALQNGELTSGRGLNQETSLKRAGDTRWGSHYGTLLNLVTMFSSVIDVLENVVDDGLNSEQRAEARVLLQLVQSFDFVFNLYLMRNVLGITNELSKALQRKDHDIVNAMTLVKISKQRLQKMRDDEWDSLLTEVFSFCEKHDIATLNMDDVFVVPGRSRRKASNITNLHHYQVELFYAVIDRQLQELNSRFTEINTELLLCVACLTPDSSFSAFDKQKLIRLAQFYQLEFSAVNLMALDNQLETYIIDMRSNCAFSNIKGIGSLAEKLVETKKDIVYPLVYLLVKLALILPVATASVERAFSAMKIVKNRLRNRMGDTLMNNCLVTYIEKDVFCSVDKEDIVQHFQNMSIRRGQL